MRKKLTALCILVIVAAISFVNFRLFFTHNTTQMPAQQTDSSVEWIDGYYGFKAAPFPRDWKFPFAREWFTHDATEYNHLLAQSSLGMALSSFRIRDTDLIYQGEAIKEYLEQAHFQDIKALQYDNEPTVDTVATTMGWQKIDDFTLLVVSVCGGGYRNEWLSNFTIGDETRHVGFNSASQKVQQRIWDYIDEHNLDKNNIKVWISGFSRAAAISNITAGDLCESDVFSEETVFNYNFACPRTTKEPKAYRNIFNILGKNDYVPMVPFGEWGFGRNGTDLYLPAPESDSSYGPLSQQSNMIMRQLCNDDNRTNPGTNHILHMLMEFLTTVVPDTKTYVKVFQNPLKNMWADRSANNLITNIYGIMLSNDMLSPQDETDIKFLQSYLISKLYQEMFVGKYESDWNISLNVTTNFTREHYPDVYLSWMFSTNDPEKLFTPNEEHALISIDYDGTIDIVDENRNFLYRVTPQGDVIKNVKDDYYNYDLDKDKASKLYISRTDSTTLIMLPLDKTYQFVLPHYSKDLEVGINTILYNNQVMHGKLDGLYEFNSASDSMNLLITPHYEDGKMSFTTNTSGTFTDYSGTTEYSIGYVSLMLNGTSFISSSFRLESAAIIFIGVVILVLVIGLILVAKRRGLETMFLLLSIILVCMQELGINFIPLQLMSGFMKNIGYTASGAALIASVLRLIKKHTISDYLVTLGALLFIGSYAIINIPVSVLIILEVVGLSMVIFSIIITHPPKRWQWITGGILIAAEIALLVMNADQNDLESLLFFGSLLSIIIIALTSSFNQRPKLRIAIWMLIIFLIMSLLETSISPWIDLVITLLWLTCVGWIVTLVWKEVDENEQTEISQ